MLRPKADPEPVTAASGELRPHASARASEGAGAANTGSAHAGAAPANAPREKLYYQAPFTFKKQDGKVYYQPGYYFNRTE